MTPAQMPEGWAKPVEDFLSYKKASGASEQTLKTRMYQLYEFAKKSGTTPDKITPQHVTTALADCKAQYTRKGLRNALSTFFRYLKETGYRDDNPAAALPNIRAPRPHPKPCPDRYINDALEKATESERLMLLLASECGLRRSEIAAVHSDDVMTGVRGLCSLLVHGKGDKQRIIPLPEALADRIKAAHGYLFPGRWEGHVEASYIGEHISHLLPEGYSAHKLRHRFATVAYSDSHDLLAVSKALGHASTEITTAYVALPDESLRRLVSAATIEQQSASADHDDNVRATGISTELPAGECHEYDSSSTSIEAPDDIRAAGPIITRLAALLAFMITGDTSRSFNIRLRDFNAIWHMRCTIDELRAAAGLLQGRNLIELASVDDDKGVCGNLTASWETIRYGFIYNPAILRNSDIPDEWEGMDWNNARPIPD